MLEVVIGTTFLSRPGAVTARLEGNRIRLRTPRMTSYLASLRPQTVTPQMVTASNTWMAEKFHDFKLYFELSMRDELMADDDPKPGPLEWKAARAQSRETGLKKIGKR